MLLRFPEQTLQDNEVFQRRNKAWERESLSIVSHSFMEKKYLPLNTEEGLSPNGVRAADWSRQENE